MSWRIVATVLITVMTLFLVGAFLAPVAAEVATEILATGQYNGQYLNEDMPMQILGSVLDGILLAAFGLMIWAFVRVLRKEVNRGGF